MPLAGAAIGAASGAIGGALSDVGINDKWMKETAALELRPNVGAFAPCAFRRGEVRGMEEE